MEQLQKEANSLNSQLQSAKDKIGFSDLVTQLAEINSQLQDGAVWNDPENATQLSKHLTVLKKRLEPWRKLTEKINELRELIDLGDQSLESDLRSQLECLCMEFEIQKKELMYSGPYDDKDAIVSIFAGAGGTDAQDWAQMLLRMYTRWAEQHEYSVELIDQSSGEEAGIKSASMIISGSLVFGKLRSEHGVHRLVRLSPFNSDNLRQTSFAKVDVLPKIDQPQEVVIDDKDLKIDVFRAGGHGGQSVNTTDSAVRITHIPTGITVSIQNERSQLQNKETAMTILRSRLVQLQLEQHKESITELKGPNEQAAWGNQIRSYVLHPYKQVKDLRSKFESSDPNGILDGNLDELLESFHV